MRKTAALALLMCFSATALSACEPKRIVQNIPPNPALLVCAPAGARPAIPAETVIDWSKVTTVAQAKVEHEGYVKSVRNREGVIAGYILDIEGKLNVCATNMQGVRDYFKATAAP